MMIKESSTMTGLPEHPFGRVEEDGSVFVTEDGQERQVGQYPDGTPQEALDYFVRKFDDLAAQVSLLEQRSRAGANSNDIARSVAALRGQLDGAAAVGDFASLRGRLDALKGEVAELSEKQQAEHREALGEALAYRETIVVEAEQLAAQDPASIQWKQTSAKVEELFARWQDHQKTGPRLPKGDANALWKRFRVARTTLDTERRKFFAHLDTEHRAARDAKQSIIERAEALAPKGADGVPEYRRRLDEWKTVGRAGRKHDDALWAKFKAAGDVLYQAKAEVDARDDEEYQENLTLKLAILDDAKPILDLTDRRQARERLNQIQDRWEAVGRVPRDRFRDVEEQLRRIEQHVRKLDDDHWANSNPEKQARQSGMASQLHEAIAQLESEVTEARASGDAKRIKEAEEALSARQAWLRAVEG
jgi:polyhydroxyalkanoate synthesis regulator phasin